MSDLIHQDNEAHQNNLDYDQSNNEWITLDNNWLFHLKSRLYYHIATKTYYTQAENGTYQSYDVTNLTNNNSDFQSQTTSNTDNFSSHPSIIINNNDIHDHNHCHNINHQIKINANARFMQGRRAKQEDRHVCIGDLFDILNDDDVEIKKSFYKQFSNISPRSFYGLFDGHCGTLASDFCSKTLPKNLLLNLLRIDSNTSLSTSLDPKNLSSYLNSTQSNNKNSDLLSSDLSSNKSDDSASTSILIDSCESSSLSQNLISSTNLSSSQFSQSCDFPSSVSSDSVNETCLDSLNPKDDKTNLIGNFTIDEIKEATISAFMQTDKEFLSKYRLARDGCTAVVTLILNDHIFIASLGDSRAILVESISDNDSQELRLQPIRAAEDHKPSRKDEKERIENSGGKVIYVQGVARVAPHDYEQKAKRIKMETCMQGAAAIRPPILLAVSRSFGDRDFKTNDLIIAKPEIFAKKIIYKFVVMACDGIWDVMTDEEVVSLVSKHMGDPTEASSVVVKEAFNRKSQDNLTVVVIFFD